MPESRPDKAFQGRTETVLDYCSLGCQANALQLWALALLLDSVKTQVYPKVSIKSTDRTSEHNGHTFLHKTGTQSMTEM